MPTTYHDTWSNSIDHNRPAVPIEDVDVEPVEEAVEDVVEPDEETEEDE